MSSNKGIMNILYAAFLLAAVAMLFFTVGKGCNKEDSCCRQVEKLIHEKKILEDKLVECCPASSCEEELKYFVEREFQQMGKLVTGSFMIDLFKENMVKQGVQYLGPSCDKIGGKFIISFHATGKSTDGGHYYDHYAKFEVNSQKEEIIPKTELAETMAPFLGLE